MRVLSALFLVVISATACSSGGETGSQTEGGTAQAPAVASKPVGDLAQLMRGVLFPNSNLIFDAQSNDPGAPKKAETGGGGATATFANVYTGWEVVENAGITLAEVTDLVLKPGRLCSNGKPVPLDRPDFVKFAEDLRAAGVAAFEAAKTKSQDKVIENTNQLADACAACHEIYRDRGPAGSPERCTAP
jgi:hypothetical protein